LAENKRIVRNQSKKNRIEEEDNDSSGDHDIAVRKSKTSAFDIAVLGKTNDLIITQHDTRQSHFDEDESEDDDEDELDDNDDNDIGGREKGEEEEEEEEEEEDDGKPII